MQSFLGGIGRGASRPGRRPERLACTLQLGRGGVWLSFSSVALGSGVLERPKPTMAGCLVRSRQFSCSSSTRHGTDNRRRRGLHRRCRTDNRPPPGPAPPPGPLHERDAPWQPNPAARPHPPTQATSGPPRWPTDPQPAMRPPQVTLAGHADPTPPPESSSRQGRDPARPW